VNALDHPLVEDYLTRFDRAASVVPTGRRLALRREIEAHLRDAIPRESSDEDAALTLHEFGSPDEIVAQEMEGADAEPLVSGRSRRRVLVVGAVVFVLIALVLAVVLPVSQLASQASEPFNVVSAHPRGVDRITEGRAYEEYQAAQSELPPLPRGAEWPEGLMAGLNAGPTEDGSGIMEACAGAVTAQFTWLCAWESEYISAEDHAADARLVTALATLEDFASSDFAQTWSPDWRDVVVGPLRLDDSSMLRAGFADVCLQAGITDVAADVAAH
jgi:hypothetical protein